MWDESLEMMLLSAYSLHRCALISPLGIFGENHPLGNFLESGSAFPLIKLTNPKIPHIKLECVDLCGLGGVGGMNAPIQFQIFKENGTLLDKPPFLALKRCVKHIIIFISHYIRNFLLYLDTNAH
jgi:hypothetical protein